MRIVFHQRWSSRRATGPISTNKVSSLTHLWVALGTVRSEFFYLSLAIADYIVVVAGRTLLQSIITSLERITFDGDPLQFLVESTTYQPFISLFAQTEMAKSDPTLKGIRACDHRIVYISSFNRRLVANFASALAIAVALGFASSSVLPFHQPVTPSFQPQHSCSGPVRVVLARLAWTFSPARAPPHSFIGDVGAAPGPARSRRFPLETSSRVRPAPAPRGGARSWPPTPPGPPGAA